MKVGLKLRRGGAKTPCTWGSLCDLCKTQVKKEKFWEIDEDFLLEIGTCIGELMFAKLKVMSEHF